MTDTDTDVVDGGPAFPHLADTCQRIDETEHWPGLSIRDWFAGQALLLSAALVAETMKNDPTPETVADTAWKIADAMLKQRDRGR